MVVPKRPRPIWFAGSGAIQAEWSALPGGARVVRDLEGLEERGRRACGFILFWLGLGRILCREKRMDGYWFEPVRRREAIKSGARPFVEANYSCRISLVLVTLRPYVPAAAASFRDYFVPHGGPP